MRLWYQSSCVLVVVRVEVHRRFRARSGHDTQLEAVNGDGQKTTVAGQMESAAHSLDKI